MELTAHAKSFRASFKKMMGMRANASHLDVLAVIKQVYIDNGIYNEFLEKIQRHKAEDLMERI